MLYRSLLRPLLFLLPAETAHHVGTFALRVLQALPGVAALLHRWLRVDDARLKVKTLGQTFDHPVGLAAGFDKDARVYRALAALGLACVEVGTVTAKAQPGNPKPRLFRLRADRALINRMGFNNAGAEVAQRQFGKPRLSPVGVNIGKSKVTPEEEAAEDYVESATRLAPVADYLVVNVSSPNTPGLRNLQAVEKLEPLLRSVREAMDRAVPERKVPLLVKIAPDLADEDVDRVADMALELGLDGIIATNTTLSRSGLETSKEEVEAIGAGGLSGAPLRERALQVIRRLRRRVGDRLVLVAAGGIETADDAWQRIRAGATLVQIYTGFIYGGPLTARTIAQELAEHVTRAGLANVTEAVGADVDPAAPRQLPSEGNS